MKLLLVDDDVDLCEMLQLHFEARFDFRIFTAHSGLEALQCLEEECPEGMLLDVNLGSRLTGFDVLTRAKQISPGTKTIMVTGRDDFQSVERALSLGAVDYVTKPFSVDYLEETVATKIAKLLYA